MFDLLASPLRRRALFTLLYLSEGAPIGFLWWAMPTRMREANVAVADITWLTALLVLPWTFKFLWAPAVDALQGRWWTLKQSIIAAQVLMGAALLPLVWLDLRKDFSLIVGCLICHAVAAATQDVAIDAMCIRTTAREERGRLNGWMQAGMLVGRAGLGGGALWLGAHIGQAGVVIVLVGVTWSSMLVLMLTKASTKRMRGATSTVGESLQQLGSAALLAARQRSTWFALAFALTAGAAYEGLGVIAGPLLVDHGFAGDDIGYFYGLPILLCTFAGSLLGGRLADRWTHRRTTALSLLWIVAAALGTSLAVGGAAVPWASAMRLFLLVLTIHALYLGIGMFTASSYALFMDITTPGIAGTQFSTFMSATNGCESWSALAIGRAERNWGYADAIALLCLPSVLALLLLLWMRPPASKDAGVAGDPAKRSPQ